MEIIILGKRRRELGGGVCELASALTGETEAFK